MSAADYTDMAAAFAANAVKSQENPAMPQLPALTRTQYFIFSPGESYGAKDYDEICRVLTPALAKRGFVNLATAEGRVANPEKLELILRVSYGDRMWRVPSVRVDHLTWKTGIAVDRASGFIQNSAGVAWDRRAGGMDDEFSRLVRWMNTNGGKSFDTDPASSMDASVAATAEGITRTHHLLVIDAFSYQELLAKGDKAKRVWTTFIAMPRRANETFGEVFATMVRVGTPYFGTTTRGVQVFTDARARVEPGDLKVLESDVKLPTQESDPRAHQ